MIRFSQILLSVASILAFRFLAICRIGPEWEIPSEIIQKSMSILLTSTFVFLISFLSWLISIKSFRKIALPFKIVYFIWNAIVVIIYIIGWSQNIYNWSIPNHVLIQVLNNVYYLGLCISLVLQITLEFGNRQAFDKF